MAAFKRQQLGGHPKDSAADGTTADSGPDGIIQMILQQSMEWKKNRTPGEGLPLRQRLLVLILTTLLERAQKIHNSKQGTSFWLPV